jgi:CheY-specific phosphatase CheX
MNKVTALKIISRMKGRQYGYMKDWGLSTIQEACTYLHRVKITDVEQEILDTVENKISCKY